MAEVAMNTSAPDASQRSYGYGAAQLTNLAFAANTSVAYQYVTAPADGILKAVTVKGTVTSTATATYTFVVNNMSVDTDPAMVGTSLFDADPVLTADVAANLVMSATNAVSKGDIIRVGFTGGSGSGLAGVLLEFEAA